MAGFLEGSYAFVIPPTRQMRDAFLYSSGSQMKRRSRSFAVQRKGVKPELLEHSRSDCHYLTLVTRTACKDLLRRAESNPGQQLLGRQLC
ncbi:hypothetical protein AVEN_252857-1 [Araneus ventricosus]|uniref:Uncharacterized protein n=1 Tax=Araneus ventricosus TaxID=182803 RepID=A0A4Y2NCV5_ARAVE|nr:hypothetical protein AVEN_252857-1 [Araneus ventricosus]